MIVSIIINVIFISHNSKKNNLKKITLNNIILIKTLNRNLKNFN